MGVMPPQLALLQMLEERAMHTTGEGAAPWGSGLGTETAFAEWLQRSIKPSVRGLQTREAGPGLSNVFSSPTGDLEPASSSWECVVVYFTVFIWWKYPRAVLDTEPHAPQVRV